MTSWTPCSMGNRKNGALAEREAALTSLRQKQRVLVEDMVEAVSMFPDHLEVKVGSAPPLLVELGEVGLRGPATRSSVSEDRDVDDDRGVARAPASRRSWLKRNAQEL